MRLALRFAIGVACFFPIWPVFSFPPAPRTASRGRSSPVLRDGFETPGAGRGRASILTPLSGCSSTIVRSGPHTVAGCRNISISNPELGSQFFVSYATPKISVSNELKVGLYVRSDRAGARVSRQDRAPGGRRPGDQGPVICS